MTIKMAVLVISILRLLAGVSAFPIHSASETGHRTALQSAQGDIGRCFGRLIQRRQPLRSPITPSARDLPRATFLLYTTSHASDPASDPHNGCSSCLNNSVETEGCWQKANCQLLPAGVDPGCSSAYPRCNIDLRAS
jgi:hypothetical protein